MNSATRTYNSAKKSLPLLADKYASTIGVVTNKITEKIDEEDKISEGYDGAEDNGGGTDGKSKRLKML